jgi:hypothetical protein
MHKENDHVKTIKKKPLKQLEISNDSITSDKSPLRSNEFNHACNSTPISTHGSVSLINDSAYNTQTSFNYSMNSSYLNMSGYCYYDINHLANASGHKTRFNIFKPYL